MKTPLEIWVAIGRNIKERLEEGDGIWRTCSGCYEAEAGYPNYYPHSSVFNCTIGGGCSECGGLGTVWDTTDYATMGEEEAPTISSTHSQAGDGQ